MTISDIFCCLRASHINQVTDFWSSGVNYCNSVFILQPPANISLRTASKRFKMKLISRYTFTAVIICFNSLQTLPHTTCELLIKLFGNSKSRASCVLRVNVADDIGSLSLTRFTQRLCLSRKSFLNHVFITLSRWLMESRRNLWSDSPR